VQQNLQFLNTGTSQIPGLIVMELEANGRTYDGFNHILVVFNAATTQQSFTSASLTGRGFALHPVQQGSSDSVVRTATFNPNTGTATVPGLTTAVFVSAQ